MVSWYRGRAAIAAAVLVVLVGAVLLIASANSKPSAAPGGAGLADAGPSAVASAPNAALTTWDDPALPFYGMEFVPIDELPLMQQMGINMVLQAFDYEGTPEEWRAYLDAAHRYDIRVVAQLWPEGWRFDTKAQTWQIDERARFFLNAIKDHPALFAIYALHEPYWNGCDGCGYTTAQQQALYRDLKAIAAVPIYSEVDSMAFWTAQGEATAFADGICDYCQTLYYPFKLMGIYERDQLATQIAADMEVARARAPNSRIIWTMQGFAQGAPYFLRMPSADEMHDMATIVYAHDVAGAWWYPWKFSDLYSDTLGLRTDLHPMIRTIFDTVVVPRRSQPTPVPTAPREVVPTQIPPYMPPES